MSRGAGRARFVRAVSKDARSKLLLDRRMGVVSAVNSDGTCTLTLGGSSTVITNARALAGALVYAGATVWCLQVNDGDWIILGVQEVATGWSTVTTGFTAASNWSLTSVRWRRIGSLAWLYVVAQRTTTGLTIAAGDGDITNTAVLSAVPALLSPAQNQYGGSGATGRTATFSLGSALNIVSAAGDGTNIANGDSISADFRAYPVD